MLFLLSAETILTGNGCFRTVFVLPDRIANRKYTQYSVNIIILTRSAMQDTSTPGSGASTSKLVLSVSTGQQWITCFDFRPSSTSHSALSLRSSNGQFWHDNFYSHDAVPF